MNDAVPHPGPAEVNTANSLRRLTAGLVDLTICLPLWAAGVMWSWPTDLPKVPWSAFDTAIAWLHADPWVGLAPVAWAFGIGLVFNLAFQGRGRETPGKRLLKLRTINRRGHAPSAGHALGYGLLRCVSSAIALGGHLWALVDRQRRTLHDRLAGVWVIHDP